MVAPARRVLITGRGRRTNSSRRPRWVACRERGPRRPPTSGSGPARRVPTSRPERPRLRDLHARPGRAVRRWNAGAERIKGYTDEEIVGRHFSVFYTEEDRARGTRARARVAARDGRYEEEGWRVRKDGTRFWANVVDHGDPRRRRRAVGFAKVTRDLTERRRAEEALRDDARELRTLQRGARSLRRGRRPRPQRAARTIIGLADLWRGYPRTSTPNRRRSTLATSRPATCDSRQAHRPPAHVRAGRPRAGRPRRSKAN